MAYDNSGVPHGMKDEYQRDHIFGIVHETFRHHHHRIDTTTDVPVNHEQMKVLRYHTVQNTPSSSAPTLGSSPTYFLTENIVLNAPVSSPLPAMLPCRQINMETQPIPKPTSRHDWLFAFDRVRHVQRSRSAFLAPRYPQTLGHPHRHHVTTACTIDSFAAVCYSSQFYPPSFFCV